MIIDMGQNIRRYGKVVFYIPEKRMRRKRKKISAIFFTMEKKRRRKRRELFVKGKHIF